MTSGVRCSVKRVNTSELASLFEFFLSLCLPYVVYTQELSKYVVVQL